MNFTEGKIFFSATPEEVLDHFKSNKYDNIYDSPGNYVIRYDDKILILQNRRLKKEYIIRKAFISKLLKWYNINDLLLSLLSDEVLVKMFNQLLQNIKRNMIVKTENNEALSIHSTNYTNLENIKVYETIKHLTIDRISHNDYITRFITAKKKDMAIMTNDLYGFNIEVINSNTGFSPVQINHTLLRYICKNGATVPIDIINSSKNHYNVKDLDLVKFVNSNISRADESRLFLIQKINRLALVKAADIKSSIIFKVNLILAENNSYGFFRDYDWSQNRYDLFNHITHMAKSYDLTKKYLLQRLAGDIILN
jgi:hypothetical protein